MNRILDFAEHVQTIEGETYGERKNRKARWRRRAHQFVVAMLCSAIAVMVLTAFTLAAVEVAPFLKLSTPVRAEPVEAPVNP